MNRPTDGFAPERAIEKSTNSKSPRRDRLCLKRSISSGGLLSSGQPQCVLPSARRTVAYSVLSSFMARSTRCLVTSAGAKEPLKGAS
ncbi:hypothetical protein, partial [Bacteroides sp.]|uniref:hypothetical protein n=1 Tax=Bacteroides sp. TaxID=29523 RepID=UPI002FC5DCA3